MASPDPPPGFGVENVDFSFGAYQVLRDVTLAVVPGEIHALVGRHNEGKSTLCGIMTGRLAPGSGRVIARGTAHGALSPIQARRLGIAGLSSTPRIYAKRTVLENLIGEDGRFWLGWLPARKRSAAVGAWLEENGISLPLNVPMHEVPRGLWVVVETLTKLYRRPEFLVMDQAIEELKQPWFGRLLALLGKHLRRGMGMLMVTHKIEDALSIADRVTVMRHGKIVATNPASDVERLSLIRLSYAQLDDFDERFASQERFQEILRYTEAMLRDLPSAVIILATDRRVRFVNRSAQRLFPSALAEDGGPFDGGNPLLRDAILDVARSGRESELHAVPIATGKGGIVADVRIRSLYENNARIGTIIAIDDVSPREELRSRLILSEQLSSIGLLASGVAHEVNNPLEIIGNYLNYLRDDPASPDSPEVISHIEEEVARIQEIVNNLVSSAGRAGKDECVDVMAMARELSALLGFHAGFGKVRFVFSEPESPVLLNVNAAEMRQVVLNLMRNSIDAMGGDGEIRVGCERRRDREGSLAVLSFADTGPGISLANPNDVFLPFTTTKKGTGRHQGLGLYIVFGIVKKHGGTISAANVPGGCRFTLRFPG
ncbi:MAG: ATP-binding cassette domain-containing protein [Planctomycetota bacterium]|jgi:signal transduction histidine kinase/ABC-type branched-subunit amino acid transport system ATPase component|nr:ATP-binding cassette domain-containing protein [Planctomycetota bacterium]